MAMLISPLAIGSKQALWACIRFRLLLASVALAVKAGLVAW